MKEIQPRRGWEWEAWFRVDKEEFSDGQGSGQCRYRLEKAVGRDTDGRLMLAVRVNRDRYDRHNFRQTFYEIDLEEYITFLDRAILRREVGAADRRQLIEKAKAPFVPQWDIHRDVEVYRDGRYALGQKDGRAYLTAAGKRYLLSGHPYEPCLYITDETGGLTAVHNAFDPFQALEAFYAGRTVVSVTGREYGAADFCRMAEYAAGKGDIGISVAEKVFGDNTREDPREPATAETEKEGPPRQTPPEGDFLPDDPFYALIARYPRVVIDYCLVKNREPYRGEASHRAALDLALRRLLSEDGDGPGLHWDIGKAKGKSISAGALFSAEDDGETLTYRKAFLDPPHGSRCTEADFRKVNGALFPNGTNRLAVMEWSTDWSDYFDDGHEWWGALCCTVYDGSLDRFAVILASATD